MATTSYDEALVKSVDQEALEEMFPDDTNVSVHLEPQAKGSHLVYVASTEMSNGTETREVSDKQEIAYVEDGAVRVDPRNQRFVDEEHLEQNGYEFT